jgi:hypothetical protein
MLLFEKNQKGAGRCLVGHYVQPTTRLVHHSYMIPHHTTQYTTIRTFVLPGLQIAKKLRALPALDLTLPTLALVGAPNMGKSSLVQVSGLLSLLLGPAVCADAAWNTSFRLCLVSISAGALNWSA